MNIALNKDEFWNISPAYSEIFKYLEKISETEGNAWGFDTGSAGADRKTSYALFLCTALTGFGN